LLYSEAKLSRKFAILGGKAIAPFSRERKLEPMYNDTVFSLRV